MKHIIELRTSKKLSAQQMEALKAQAKELSAWLDAKVIVMEEGLSAHIHEEPMTLRDRFALKAYDCTGTFPDKAAIAAYKAADEALKVRSLPQLPQ